MHDYDKIAAIVGEDKINALREAGVEIADKPKKPTTGLLGRWAKDKDGTDVLIIGDKAVSNGSILVAFFNENGAAGAKIDNRCLEDLTFPEETTRPEDVPVGEAWLIEVDGEQRKAVKNPDGDWHTSTFRRKADEVTLIAPLVPARPMDSDRERAYWEQQAQIDSYERERTPETVTTEEEYAELPAGSIVASASDYPFTKSHDGSWRALNYARFHYGAMSEVARTVLRKGWGE